MNDLNTVLIEGRVVRDPESKPVGSSSVVNFALAVNRRYRTRAGETREEVSYIDVEAWGKLADNLVRYCSKGRQLRVEGSLVQDRWNDADGNQRSRMKVSAGRIEYGAKPEGDRASASDAPAASSVERAPVPSPASPSADSDYDPEHAAMRERMLRNVVQEDPEIF